MLVLVCLCERTALSLATWLHAYIISEANYSIQYCGIFIDSEADSFVSYFNGQYSLPKLLIQYSNSPDVVDIGSPSVFTAIIDMKTAIVLIKW